MKRLLKALTWTHRYLGIVLSALFLTWFLTGIGMIYSRGMPRLTPEVRLARLSPLALDKIKLTPGEAAAIAGVADVPGPATLLTLLDRPVYRFPRGYPQTVFADNGEGLSEVSASQAKVIAARFMELPESHVGDAALITEPDQWTLNEARQLPLYKFTLNDNAGTRLYVSPELGEVVQLSTRSSRMLAWVSTIPHFLYFRSLRLNSALWNEVVVWTAGIGCILAILGIVLGVWHFRPSRIPYSGWMRWHYVSGLVFGIFTLTFVFSGLLSMEPWAWANVDNSLEEATGEAFPTGAGDLARFSAIDPEAWTAAVAGAPVKEIEFASIMAEPYYIARSASGLDPKPGPPDGGHQPYYVMRGVDPSRWVIAADGLRPRSEPFSASDIGKRLGSALPDVPILESTILEDYDSYYYSRDRRAPLPVLRIKLADPDKTWVYVDPEVSQVVGRVNRLNRAERWLYNGLHSLDFSFWYYNRPLWDAVMIVLSLGGAIVSGMGLLLGIRRVVRGMKRTVANVVPS